MAYLDENGLEYFWGKIKDHVDSAVAPKADDADVVHKTGDVTIDGAVTLQNTASGHAAGETVTDLIIRNPEVERGVPVEEGRSYTRIILADAEGDTEQTFAGRLGLLEVVSPKENDTIGEELRLGCYKYSDNSADYGKYSGFRAGYDLNGIPFSTAPATSDERTDSTDIVTRGYMEASEWNWQKTKKAGAVTFKPVPESDLEPVVDFLFMETPPAGGEKGPENPSTITGVSSVNITRCGKNILAPKAAGTTTTNGVTITSNGDGTYTLNGTSTDQIFYHLPRFGENWFQEGVVYTAKVNASDLSQKIQIWIGNSLHGGGFFVEQGTFIPTKTIENNAVAVYVTGGKTLSNVIVKPQIEIGSLATSFEVGTGNAYAVSLGDTYYGGTLDVATGLMTVTWVAVELNGTESWDAIGNNYNSTTGIGFTRCYPHSLGLQKKAALDVTTNSVCSHFSYLGGFGTSGVTDGSVTTPQFYYTNGTDSVNGQARFAVPYSDVADFKTWLAAQKTAGTPVMLTYKIYEPFTVQLTPTQIRSLPALDKYEPRINTVYTDQEAVQVGYQRYADTMTIVHTDRDNTIKTYSFAHRNVDNASLTFSGGSSITKGARLALNGSASSTNPSCFSLVANDDGTNYKSLVGSNTGNLTWDGQPLQTSSDERVKTALSTVPDDVLDAWEAVNWGQFQYLEAVQQKGEESARLHLGLIAQHVMSVFEKHGLDACAYGILCHEERPAVDEKKTVVDAEAYVDDEGVKHPAVTHVETRHVQDAVDLWMVRYAEAQAMEACCMRRENARLKKRIADLEERLAALERKIS